MMFRLDFLHRCLAFTTMLFATACVQGQVQDAFYQTVSRIGKEIDQNATDTTKRTIAIADMVNVDGSTSALGQGIAASLCTELVLVNKSKFEVVERRQLAQVLREQKLTSSALFENSTNSAKVGELLKVSEIVTGEIIEIGDDLEINVHLVSVSTGRITSGCRVRCPNKDAIAIMHRKPAAADRDPQLPNHAVDPNIIDRQVIEGLFIVEVTKVTRKTDSVEVEAFLESTVRDLDVRLVGSACTMVTNQGMQHPAVYCELGTDRGRSTVDAPLLKGVRTRASLLFRGVASDATSFEVLTIKGLDGNRGADVRHNWNVEFRGLPIK